MTAATSVRWTPPAPGEVPAPNFPDSHADIHSHANLFDIVPKHLDLDWTVDWEKRTLAGRVTHTLHAARDGVEKVKLDTSFLDIHRIVLLDAKDDNSPGTEAKWELGKRRGTIGSPLSIQLNKQYSIGSVIKIAIDYSTTGQCTALGWLSKEQTDSKEMPFLYSQAQAIHARSMLPCADSPSHKITYTSKVRSKYPVLMSALAEGSIRATTTDVGNPLEAGDVGGQDGTYRFRQPVGIPTYLIAIVGGNLVFRALAPRVGVWAEPTMIDRVEWEFKADANRFLEAAEQTISPYSWTRYDSVVLPPSFPYGGMENANLTTLTPTLISGDRSQTDVLLHELGHSWSGNLTSCANWASFWLNEGINVWIERLLLSIVHGEEAGTAIRGLHYIIGQKALFEAIDQFNETPRFQRLVPEFKEGEDPDDAFSSIPYEKGSTFIIYLERVVGGLDLFLPFIRNYFKAFYDRSISTQEFKQHIFDYYKGNADITEKLEGVDWDAWLHGEGKKLPAPVPFDDSLAQQVYKLGRKWEDFVDGHATDGSHKFGPGDISGWDPNQIVLFLARLRERRSISAEVASTLDKAYGFGSHTNTEIRSGFYSVALQAKDGKYANEAAKWVAVQGRMKYCRPLYRALHKVEPELARKTFLANRTFYHPIAASMIAIVSAIVGKMRA